VLSKRAKEPRRGVLRIESNCGGKGSERVRVLVAEKVQECEISMGEGELGIELSGLLEKRLGLLKLSVKREESSRIGVYFSLRKRARGETGLGNFCRCRDLNRGKRQALDVVLQILLKLAEISKGFCGSLVLTGALVQSVQIRAK